MQGSRGARKGRRVLLSVLVVLFAGAASVTVAIAASSAHTNRSTLTYTQSAGGPEGTGTVQSKPKGIKCAAACDEAVASMYEDETVVLKAKASNGSSLSSWSGCESSTNTGTEGTCTVKMTKDQEVEATWGNTSKAIGNPQPLTVSRGESSGTGTVKGTGGLGCETECTSTTVLYQGETGVAPKVKLGKSVTLKEAAAFGSEFTGWSGGGCSGAGETCTVTMNAAATVTATFTAKPITTLTVEKAGTGTGTVSSQPKALNCGTTCTSQSAAVPEEAEVVLKEKPATGPFEGWTGACTGAGENCTVKLSAAGTVRAKFGGTAKAILNAQALTLNKVGSGYGTVKAAGLACEVLCASTTNLYQGPTGVAPKNKPGKTVILKAASAPGSKQVVWTGCESEPTPTECSATMESAKTVTATFDEVTAAGGSATPELSLCGEISHNETISPNYAERYTLTCDVTVDEGVTLDIEAGALLKAENGVALIVNGTLNAIGTGAEPITFTSINDNTVGTTTGSGSPEAGDWSGILTLGEHGSIDLEHAKVSYANTALTAYGQGSAVVKHDTFASQTSGAAWISGAESPTLEDNSSTDSGENVPTFVVDSPALDADRLGANSATGSGILVVQLTGFLGKSSTLPAEPAAWAIGNGLSGGLGYLEVPDGKTLTIAAGAVIKGKGGGGCAYNLGCDLLVNGTLNAIGTGAEPITFTSINDNTVGTTTGSGSPEAGDWSGILTLGEHGSIDLEHAKVSYANTALTAYGQGQNAVRGRLNHNLSDIQACDWGSSCSVDAAFVDWGREEGPTSPELVCGAVTTSPYLYEGSSHEAGSGSENCDSSPTPWEALDSGQAAFNEGIAHAEIECAELGDDVCEVIGNAFNCLSAAFDLGAGQLPFALPNPFSGGVSGSDWKSSATTVGSTGAKWLSDSADPVIADIGKVASRGFQIIGVAGTFISLANAYNQCAP